MLINSRYKIIDAHINVVDASDTSFNIINRNDAAAELLVLLQS